MWIQMQLPGTQLVHVFPIPDSGGHRIAEDCYCPCLAQPLPDEPRIIVHRSWDFTDLIDEAERVSFGIFLVPDVTPRPPPAV